MAVENESIKDKYSSLFDKDRAHRGLTEIQAAQASNEKPIYYESRKV